MTLDIDIERLWLCKSKMDLATERPHWCRGMGHDGCGWRFLVFLADQNEELWVDKPCDHGGLAKHFVCDGGSRVRVWPKEGE